MERFFIMQKYLIVCHLTGEPASCATPQANASSGVCSIQKEYACSYTSSQFDKSVGLIVNNCNLSVFSLTVAFPFPSYALKLHTADMTHDLNMQIDIF